MVLAVVLLLAIAALIAPGRKVTSSAEASFDQVRNIMNARCTSCHADAPVHPAFPAAPLGVVLDTDERIRAEAMRIHQQTVVTRVMPIGNLTAMTDEERQVIDRWYQGLKDQ